MYGTDRSGLASNRLSFADPEQTHDTSRDYLKRTPRASC